MTTKEQILGIPPIDSSLQGAPNTHQETERRMGEQHDNGGVKPPSSATPTLANQSGNDAPVQTGEAQVTPPSQPVNAPTTTTTSVQDDAAASQTPLPTTEPAKPAAAGGEKKLSYVEMFQKLSGYKPPTEEEVAAEKKRQRRKAIFAAIGDGVSALANLYFVGQHGALNAYDGKSNMTTKLKAQWDKEDKEREGKAEKYLSGYMQAYKNDADEAKDARNWGHQLEREAVADQQHAEQFQFQKDRSAKQDEQWQQSFDRQGVQWNKDFELKKERAAKEDEHWDKQFKEGVRQFNVTSSQNAQRLKMEGKRLAHELKQNGGVTFTLGKGKGNVHISKDRLNAQTVSYVFQQLPANVRADVHGQEIMTMQNGIKFGTGRYEPPTTEAMLVAIGMNAGDPNVSAALQEIAGNGKKLGLTGGGGKKLGLK